MSSPIFTWSPDLGAQQTVKPTVTSTKFGDGYELRVANSINSRPKDWNVTFTKSIAEAQAILDFLFARGGVEAFSWTDPMGVVGKYVCKEWSSSQQEFGVFAISGTFNQVFEL